MTIFAVKDAGTFKEATIEVVDKPFTMDAALLLSGFVGLPGIVLDKSNATAFVQSPGGGTFQPMDNEDRGFSNPDFRITEPTPGNFRFTFLGAGLTTLLPPVDSKLVVQYRTITLGGSVITDVNAIAQAVWDKLLASANNNGSFGEAMALILAKTNDIPSDVLDALAADHNDPDTIGAKINAAGALTSTGIASAVWNFLLTGGSASDILTFIFDVQGGRWKLDNDTNEMVLFKADNTTEVARFDVKNFAGSPDAVNVAERVRK